MTQNIYTTLAMQTFYHPTFSCHILKVIALEVRSGRMRKYLQSSESKHEQSQRGGSISTGGATLQLLLVALNSTLVYSVRIFMTSE